MVRHLPINSISTYGSKVTTGGGLRGWTCGSAEGHAQGHHPSQTLDGLVISCQKGRHVKHVNHEKRHANLENVTFDDVHILMVEDGLELETVFKDT